MCVLYVAFQPVVHIPYIYWKISPPPGWPEVFWGKMIKGDEKRGKCERKRKRDGRLKLKSQRGVGGKVFGPIYRSLRLKLLKYLFYTHPILLF